MVLLITDIVSLFTSVFNGIIRAFNVTIPGFPITISQIWLGLFLLAIIVAIFSKRSDNK